MSTSRGPHSTQYCGRGTSPVPSTQYATPSLQSDALVGETVPAIIRVKDERCFEPDSGSQCPLTRKKPTGNQISCIPRPPSSLMTLSLPPPISLCPYIPPTTSTSSPTTIALPADQLATTATPNSNVAAPPVCFNPRPVLAPVSAKSNCTSILHAAPACRRALL
ncbi:hypothetical protein K402DRAFT_423273 [Aulographum hederae CBS 113979]|uniref:Uncharacterized protein n=1 Tax=Aulographum hederae CBS 113979 TaxID=1176131 RepID=A0A6G1GT73_9PEZI|nr:hypothetical protein K402DRAFT_423273 [Aulographum hederae CBS 113979]